ncbi:unnamed protein product [Meloidogyne enterolobii]|uniref:Uncharacterized protein n=7 Tax=Meloidogyne TaxID=189290 RepID=A0A6V7W2B1_MELEN|nr:FMRFamide-like peptide 14 [Meloidogyne incognita]CAD2140828.1 unnamed protein product [Meloidogyne enterolobii]CAD2170057.1 unnamed protein product [Meloidogyne enterolobii]CAD2181316.1 unnamed protein product [Meloidogyne enterolobii]
MQPSNNSFLMVILSLFCVLVCLLQPGLAENGGDNCAQLAGGDEERLLLCQLYESSTLLSQLGNFVTEGIERLAATHGLAEKDAGREKRKHEYLRFGKRKHEFVRFGRK